MVVEAKEDGIKGFRKPLSNQAERVFNRDTSTLRGVDHADESLILEFVPENRGNQIPLRREVAKDQRFIQPRPTRN